MQHCGRRPNLGGVRQEPPSFSYRPPGGSGPPICSPSTPTRLPTHLPNLGFSSTAPPAATLLSVVSHGGHHVSGSRASVQERLYKPPCPAYSACSPGAGAEAAHGGAGGPATAQQPGFYACKLVAGCRGEGRQKREAICLCPCSPALPGRCPVFVSGNAWTVRRRRLRSSRPSSLQPRRRAALDNPCVAAAGSASHNSTCTQPCCP